MTMSLGRYWTQQMLDDLERLFAIPASDTENFMTVGEIATFMRQTYGEEYPGVLNRNTVMSKIHSTGLNQKYPRKTVTAHNIGNTPKPVNRMSATHQGEGRRGTNPAGRMGVAHNTTVAKQQEAAWKEPTYEPSAHNVPMLDATDSQCRWPVGEVKGVTIACGCQRMKGSLVRPPQYCAHHMKAASGGPQTMRADKPDYRKRRAPRWA